MKTKVYSRHKAQFGIKKIVKQVVFLRNEKFLQGGVESVRKKIMKVGINTYFEETISEQKPFKDGLENTYNILRVDNSLGEVHNFFWPIKPSGSAIEMGHPVHIAVCLYRSHKGD